MSENREQHEMDDRELDSLLAEARWPAPTRKTQEHLASYWLSLHPQPWISRWSIAAAVFLAVSVGISVYLSRPVRTTPQIARHAPPSQIAPTITQASMPRSDLITSRPPSRLELAMLAVIEKESSRKPLGKSDRSGAPTPQDLRAELVEKMRTGNLSQRQAAAREFASAARAKDIPTLLEMDQTPELRDFAVPGLSRLAPPALLGSLARKHDGTQQRLLIAALLGRPAEQIADQYLQLVVDQSTRHAALVALDQAGAVSTDLFFAALDDPHVSIREAAAMVLGHIDGPQTTARLVAMAAQNRDRREAIIALADSRGGEARKFLQEASIAGPLAGTVRSVLLEHPLPD